MAAPSAESSCYRLRGTIDGLETVFVLSPGENRIGSAAGNAIVVPVTGVSRHHARLEPRPDGLWFEDLGSRNGCTVDGESVRRRAVVAGQTLGVGPVLLLVEEIDEGDARLGLDLEGDSPPSEVARAEPGTTEALAGSSSEAGTLDVLGPVEGFFGRLAELGEIRDGGLSAALELLTDQLGGRAGAFFEWHPTRGAALLAAHGDVPEFSSHPILHDLLARVEPGPGAASCRSAAARGPFSGAIAVMARSRRPPACLVVDMGRPASAAEAAALRIFLGFFAFLDRRQAGDDEAPRREGAYELVFPDSWAPCRSPAMARLYDSLRSLLDNDLPVLIEGETGVGKERVARILHDSSHRREGPFVAINCAAIAADLLEAEMFGIGDGVATGVRGRPGCFQEAAGGTLFLDEVGDMLLELQVKLLRALQEKVIRPVGRPALPVDVRVVAASNRDLLEGVENGRFRRDLYYRLAGFVVRVPPLRERRDDVPVLIEHLLRRSARGLGPTAGKRIRGLTVKALQALRDYPWPGNVRELQNELQRLVTISGDGQVVESSMLSERIRLPPADVPGAELSTGTLRLEDHVARVERQVILAALERCGGSQRRAARLLGLSRNGLASKIRRLDISP